jgi:hypothetical protein
VPDAPPVGMTDPNYEDPRPHLPRCSVSPGTRAAKRAVICGGRVPSG